MLALGDTLGDSDGLSLGLSLALGLSEGDSDALGLTLALGETLGLSDADGDTLGLSLAEGDKLGDSLGDSEGDSLGDSDALGLTLGDADGLALALALADSAEGLNAAIVNELSDGATSVQSQDTASVSGYLLSKATPPPGLTPALYATWSSNTNPPLTVQLSPEPALPEKAVTKNSQVSDGVILPVFVASFAPFSTSNSQSDIPEKA